MGREPATDNKIVDVDTDASDTKMVRDEQGEGESGSKSENESKKPAKRLKRKGADKIFEEIEQILSMKN